MGFINQLIPGGLYTLWGPTRRSPIRRQDECEPERGRADHGRRRFPLLVKDVAGLVPGWDCEVLDAPNPFLYEFYEVDTDFHLGMFLISSRCFQDLLHLASQILDDLGTYSSQM